MHRRVVRQDGLADVLGERLGRGHEHGADREGAFQAGPVAVGVGAGAADHLVRGHRAAGGAHGPACAARLDAGDAGAHEDLRTLAECRAGEAAGVAERVEVAALGVEPGAEVALGAGEAPGLLPVQDARGLADGDVLAVVLLEPGEGRGRVGGVEVAGLPPLAVDAVLLDQPADQVGGVVWRWISRSAQGSPSIRRARGIE